MKHIIKILLINLAILILPSCEGFLNEQPISEISADTFWKTRDDVRAGIAGMYDGLQAVVSARYIDWGDARSDNFTNGGTGVGSINFALNGLTSNMGEANWDALYRTISRANLAIDNLPEISGSDVSDTFRNHNLAQAYAMRAYCHFMGVRVWGAVPLLLESVSDRDYRPARTSAEEVLVSVISDLNTAVGLINPLEAGIYEINIGGIYAMLTEAYMWQKEYQKALDSSDKLLEMNRFSLAQTPAEWKLTFTDPVNSKEAIWSLFWSFTEDGSNALASRIGSGTNTSPFIMDPNLLEEWEQQQGDFRRYLTYDTLQAISTGAVQFIWKHFPLASNGEPASSLPPSNQAEVRNSLYRLSDILLLRAEAFNKLGNQDLAIGILNQIKERSGLEPVSVDMFSNQEELENAILRERQFELYAEGKRWFDLRRTGKVITVMDPLLRQRQELRGLNVVGFGDAGLELFPISNDALNENPNLEQNSPYSR